MLTFVTPSAGAGRVAVAAVLLLAAGAVAATLLLRPDGGDTPPAGTGADTAQPSLPELASDDESLATVPLSKSLLLYAVKHEQTVEVFEREVTTGRERKLFEYDESVAAEHAFNFWKELPPSIALSPASDLLAYASVDGLVTVDLETGKQTNILTGRVESVDPDNREWSTATGASLCCSRFLARPSISADGTAALVLMPQYEGNKVAVVTLDGRSACSVHGEERKFTPAHDGTWGPDGSVLMAGGAGYEVPGLWVSEAGSPCAAVNLMRVTAPGTGVCAASWSPDGRRIVASGPCTADDWRLGPGVQLIVAGVDGTVLAETNEPGFQLWPLFGPTREDVFFTHWDEFDALTPPPGGAALQRFDLATRQIEIVATGPAGMALRPVGWTGEGYLLVLAGLPTHGGDVSSTRTRLLLLDVGGGEVIYASKADDFVSFAGFVGAPAAAAVSTGP